MSAYVIHTVGPVWHGGHSQEAEKLRDCYRNSLKLAEAQGIKRIAFPNISTGVYHFPKDKAAEIAIDEVRQYDSNTIEEVVFVCFDQENYRLYQQILA
ncbi:MAG: macro domain-containing protein [Cyclobacteriaceae bacterium]|jgi:O-acetyl-ADP-ribose deacetylase (regulator of RNase III)